MPTTPFEKPYSPMSYKNDMMLQVGQPSSDPQSRRTRRRPPAAKAAAKEPKGFEFVSTDPTGKPPADARAFIRSHVMRGKNTKKRSQPEGPVRPPAKASSSKTDQEGGSPDEIASLATDYSSLHRATGREGTSDAIQIIVNKDGSVVSTLFPPSLPGPMRMPSDLSMWKFADSLDEVSSNLFFKFFTTIKEAMYPVEWCFAFDPEKTCWYQWLCQDPAYFHSVLFTVSAFQDAFSTMHNSKQDIYASTSIAPYMFSPRTRKYLRQTINLLQERLDDRNRQLDDITAAVVVSLAMVADAAGDSAAYRAHVEGLKQMVRARGGIKGFQNNRQMQVKVCRIDLSWSRKEGCRPSFVDEDMSWSPNIDQIIFKEAGFTAEPPSQTFHTLMQDVDLNLGNIFADLRAFASVANHLISSSNKLRPELFQEIMLSIEYRLLLLEYNTETDLLQEAVRLGLLAFQTSIFIHIPGIKTKYEHLGAQLQSVIKKLKPTNQAMTNLKLWMVCLGAICIFDPNEPWLVTTMSDLTAFLSWEEVRERLKTMMWIDVIHDLPGKQMYEGTATWARVTTSSYTQPHRAHSLNIPAQ